METPRPGTDFERHYKIDPSSTGIEDPAMALAEKTAAIRAGRMASEHILHDTVVSDASHLPPGEYDPKTGMWTFRVPFKDQPDSSRNLQA